MWPVLFKLGAYEIRSYWVMLLLGGIVSTVIIALASRAWRKKISAEDLAQTPTPKQMAIVTALAFLSGLAGARIADVIYNPQDFTSLQEGLFSGGMISFGGYFGAILAIVIYSRVTGNNSLKIADLIFAYMPIFDIFQRLGCLLNGCCLGRPTHCDFGMANPDNPYTLRHPVPLYLISLSIIIFIALGLIRKKPRQPGTIMLWFFLIYSPLRFIIEFFRIGRQAGFLPFITVPQVICLELFFLALTFYILLNRKNRRTL